MKKFLFIVLSWTWGILLNLIGAMSMLIAYLCNAEIKKDGLYTVCLSSKFNGGFNLGLFIFANKYYYEDIAYHEKGHGIQNAVYGVFMPFVVTIPSVIRFWYREYVIMYKPEKDLNDYYSIWFEKQASEWGSKIK